MSITDELREFIETHLYLGATAFGGWKEAAFAIADRIDAKHQKAKDEWRAKNGDMWLKGYEACHEELMEGHPVIAADLEKAGWVRLPVDADGEVIHIGDRVEDNERVARIVLTDGSWEPSVYIEKLPNVLHEHFCNEISHYHKPTVEDVLREFVERWHDTHYDDIPALFAEYAAKLRLADDGKEQ